MILNCVIIEDEKHAIELLQEHIESLPYLSLSKTYTQSVTALTEISSTDKIDIIFLDIDLPVLSGLELAKSLRSLTRFLVFTTAYHQHAVTAFELEADQYLIKPVTFAKFSRVIDKIAKSLIQPRQEVPNETEIFLKTGIRNKVIKINPAEIIYLQSKDNYVGIYTDKEDIITYLTLKEAEIIFNQYNNFIQVHKSYVIAKNRIEVVIGNTIKMGKGVEIPIGNAYKTAFFDYIKKQTLVSGRAKSPGTP